MGLGSYSLLRRMMVLLEYGNCHQRNETLIWLVSITPQCQHSPTMVPDKIVLEVFFMFLPQFILLFHLSAQCLPFRNVPTTHPWINASSLQPFS